MRHGRAPRGQRGRRRHAGVHHGLELLLRLGPCCGGLFAEEHGADDRRFPDWFLRRHPHEDHVRRHEPRHLQRALRRPQQRACGQGQGRRAEGAHGDERGRGGRVDRERPGGLGGAGLRHGDGEGADGDGRDGELVPQPQDQLEVRRASRCRPHARSDECALGRGGRSARVGARDGRGEPGHGEQRRGVGRGRERCGELGGVRGRGLRDLGHAAHRGVAR
mmetsp:Transcript_12783/g.25883  ORF Transcript_12783/g.25883 Transcript_12783/m.25883 type:complete len:220 (-) Transcript_12783:279-938(-)